jgi:hypothetical protein
MSVVLHGLIQAAAREIFLKQAAAREDSGDRIFRKVSRGRVRLPRPDLGLLRMEDALLKLDVEDSASSSPAALLGAAMASQQHHRRHELERT